MYTYNKYIYYNNNNNNIYASCHPADKTAAERVDDGGQMYVYMYIFILME